MGSSGLCPLSQAASPVVTRAGMSPRSLGHARELLSTRQQVTSDAHPMAASLRTLCATSHLDLGLSFQSLGFTFAGTASQPPGAPPVCPAPACKRLDCSSWSQCLAWPSRPPARHQLSPAACTPSSGLDASASDARGVGDGFVVCWPGHQTATAGVAGPAM